MRGRWRRTPLFLLPLILPQLAVSAATPVDKAVEARQAPVQAIAPIDVAAPIANIAAASPSASASNAKADVGTDAAPVDGLDGKPKLGPFVDGSSAGKKKDPVVEDLGPGSKTKPKLADAAAKIDEHGATAAEREQHEELIKIAQENIMDDPNRVVPKEGTTGTEDGISEKTRLQKEQQDSKKGAAAAEPELKKPETPKEAPPLPPDEEPKPNKNAEKVEKQDEKVAGAQGMEVPKDLPDHDKLHDNPPPVPGGVEAAKPFSEPPPNTANTPAISLPSFTGAVSEVGGLIRPAHSFIFSLTMILFSEIGDKTFLVAALMAMRHPRGVVFSAALSALAAMTVLSAVLGHAVPTLLPKWLTNLAAAGLFLIFGVKLLREGWRMSPDEGVGEEMKEVEEEIHEKEHKMRRKSRGSAGITPYALEAGRGRRSRSNSKFNGVPRSPSSSPGRTPSPDGSAAAGLSNLLGLLLSPAWVQTFIMTFLGEWGDRSQIATIAMAAGQDYWWVTGGAILGHACCTGVAVVGGRAIAGKVSMRVVTLGGAYAFIVFGFIYLVEAVYAR